MKPLMQRNLYSSKNLTRNCGKLQQTADGTEMSVPRGKFDLTVAVTDVECLSTDP